MICSIKLAVYRENLSLFTAACANGNSMKPPFMKHLNKRDILVSDLELGPEDRLHQDLEFHYLLKCVNCVAI